MTNVNILSDRTMLPLFIAVDAGLFQKKGINASIELFPTGLLVQKGLAENQTPIAVTAPGHAYRLWFRGYRFRCVSVTQFGSGYDILTRAELPLSYGDFASLRGRKVGASGQGADGQVLVEYFLLSHGLDPAKDVTEVETAQMTGFDTKKETSGLHNLDALLSGKVDTIWSAPPMYYLAVSQRNVAKRFYWAGDDPIIRTLPTGGLVVRSDYLPKNRSLIESIVEALAEAAAFAKDKPEETAKICQRWLPAFQLSYEHMLAGIVDMNEKKVWATDPAVTRAQVEALNRVYETVGLASMLTRTPVKIKPIFPADECFEFSRGKP